MLRHTCGNDHSHGATVINAPGQLFCLTASIKYKCRQFQYHAKNSLQSNACFGVHLYFFAVSTAPK